MGVVLFQRDVLMSLIHPPHSDQESEGCAQLKSCLSPRMEILHSLQTPNIQFDYPGRKKKKKDNSNLKFHLINSSLHLPLLSSTPGQRNQAPWH